MNDSSSSSSIKIPPSRFKPHSKPTTIVKKLSNSSQKLEEIKKKISKSPSENTKKNEETLLKISIRRQSIIVQTKDLKCGTRLLSENFEKMSEPKKAIVRELGFRGLMHIPPMNVPHKLLKELANSFNLDNNKLDTGYEDLFLDKVSYKELSEENKLIFRRFQGKTLKNLTDEMINIGVENDHDRLMFKRIFILYIQMVFLLPTTINKVSHVHLAPIFQMDKIMEGNWGAHMLNFIIKGITNYHLEKKNPLTATSML
ncbi:hypothetical protein Ahy_A03g013718 isoform A [Arachis hypogaea]|uniref:DUF1985 domain-containing protein n=1 Tax=Arachis hypogaea TaxID=3818 RepID=A0A445DW28_ARAHY|nr:hypothetical protein Ahy_A03g013718 isoform A [Arachis hypogaea]